MTSEIPDGIPGDKFTVCLTFDFDTFTSYQAGSSNPAHVSRGEFGAVAVPRILDLLDREGIKGSFYVPGQTALTFPWLVEAIQEAGHEIGHHGWAHEEAGKLSEEDQREVFEKGAAALEKVLGVRPVGYRSPNGSYNPETLQILLDNDVEYNSHYSASDFYPYYLRRDFWSQTGEYQFGEPVDMLEMPFAWHLDDFVHFEFLGGFSTTLNPASTVREIWQGDFDWGYEHARGGVLILCMHPNVIGRGHRLQMLEGLISHMQSRHNVAFSRTVDYARRWREAHPFDDYCRTRGPHNPQPATE